MEEQQSLPELHSRCSSLSFGLPNSSQCGVGGFSPWYFCVNNLLVEIQLRVLLSHLFRSILGFCWSNLYLFI